MSTSVTVAVAAPNHLPIEVIVQSLAKSGKADVWIDTERSTIKVGEAVTHMMYAGKRLLIEEITF